MGVPITVMMIPSSQWGRKSPYGMTAGGVVLHNTANNASAMAEASYMINRNAEGSMHMYADEDRAVQTLPFNRNAWHATDGPNGYANRNLIGIEICRSTSDMGTFRKAEDNACEIAARVLKELGLPANDKTVRWHREFYNTECPHRSVEIAADRGRIVARVKAKLDALNGHPSEPPAPTAPSAGGLVRVQVGAFASEAGAKAWGQKVENAGFPVYLKKDGGLYKVQVGAFKDQANAKAYADKVKAAGFEAFIVGAAGGSPGVAAPAPATPAISDTVRLNRGALFYDGAKPYDFVYNRNHMLSELSGDRAVITYNGVVVGAVRLGDLTKAA